MRKFPDEYTHKCSRAFTNEGWVEGCAICQRSMPWSAREKFALALGFEPTLSSVEGRWERTTRRTKIIVDDTGVLVEVFLGRIRASVNVERFSNGSYEAKASLAIEEEE